MDYFVSHIGYIFIGCLIVAAAAVFWGYLLNKNEQLKRERAKARMEAVLRDADRQDVKRR
jgi:hypothetical protein